jgi:hypothetical protein
MSEPSQEATGLSGEISTSIATVWRNHCGQRPDPPETEIGSDFVRCVLTGAVADFDAGVAAATADPEGPDRPSSTYRLDAISAVGRVTRRRVLAFVSNHDAKTDVATELFILDRPLGRPKRDFPDHRRAAKRFPAD